jgi:hypothetical protein
MSAIGGLRAVEGCGSGLRVRDSQRRNPTHGRQGKRPAFGAAYVVGWIGEFGSTHDSPCWRFRQFSELNQDSKSHRCPDHMGFRL